MKKIIFLLAFTLTASLLHAAGGDLVVDGRLGLGDSNPGYRLDMRDTLTNTSSSSAVMTGYYTATADGTYSSKGLNVISRPLINSGVANLGYAIGIDNGNYIQDSTGQTGTINEITGARFMPGIYAGPATVNNVYGVRVAIQGREGTINNAYGLYLGQNTGGTITTNWGIYQAASAQSNYFAGKTGIGTTDLGEGGSRALLFGKGSIPGGLSEAAGIYAKDVNGTTQLHAFNELGDETQLSPHAGDAPDWFYDPEDGVPMIVKEVQHFLGYVRYTNMTRQARLAGMTDAEKSTLARAQRTCVFRESFEEHNARLSKTGEEALVMRDWDTEQAKIAARRAAQIAAAEANQRAMQARMAPGKGRQAEGIEDLEAVVIPEPYIPKPVPVRIRAALEAGGR
ncbi:MAG: hypothetical protein AB9866_16145 [Syntrophobacteraceae bacterium]